MLFPAFYQNAVLLCSALGVIRRTSKNVGGPSRSPLYENEATLPEGAREEAIRSASLAQLSSVCLIFDTSVLVRSP